MRALIPLALCICACGPAQVNPDGTLRPTAAQRLADEALMMAGRVAVRVVRDYACEWLKGYPEAVKYTGLCRGV